MASPFYPGEQLLLTGAIAYVHGAAVGERTEWKHWALLLYGSGVHSDKSLSCHFCLGHLVVCAVSFTV